MDTPTYIPQNDPHDALIYEDNHKWGKIFFRKKLAISSGYPSAKVRRGGWVAGRKILFVLLNPSLNSPQNCEYFEHIHKKKPPEDTWHSVLSLIVSILNVDKLGEIKCVANFLGSKKLPGAVGAQVASSNRVLTRLAGGVQRWGGGWGGGGSALTGKRSP